jgi:hypothetical protein
MGTSERSDYFFLLTLERYLFENANIAGFKKAYSLKFDRVNPEGQIDNWITVGGLPTLEAARVAYAEAVQELRERGYRTAHDHIIGPQGEVYSTQGG